MSSGFIGEICLFAGNQLPDGWAYCDGQLLPVAQFSALFSVIATSYGGDGRQTFALPDLRGRVPVCLGQGPGLSHRGLAQFGGSETVTLEAHQLPSHGHALLASGKAATTTNPLGAVPAKSKAKAYSSSSETTTMSDNAVGSGGGGHPHNNMMPGAGLHYIIRLNGAYPSRN